MMTRKPYRISKQREKWNEEEHERFLAGLKEYVARLLCCHEAHFMHLSVQLLTPMSVGLLPGMGGIGRRL
jgi:hypothetical protein